VKKSALPNMNKLNPKPTPEAIFNFPCDYPIGAYIHACSTTTNTQVEKFNKFIGYLDELETKDINSEATHLNIISSLNIKQIFINNTKNGIQRFGKKTLYRLLR
jgi:hypothetical protein